MDNLKSDKKYNLLLVLGIVFSVVYIVGNVFNLLLSLYEGAQMFDGLFAQGWLEVSSKISWISWILLLVLFGLYLNTLKFKSESSLIYVIAVISMLSLILNLIQLAITMNADNYYLISFISVPMLLLWVLQIILTFVVGFMLQSSNKYDYESLKLSGIFFIICGALEVCNLFISYFLIPIIIRHGLLDISVMGAVYAGNSLSSLGSILVGVGLFCMFWKDYNNSDNSSSSYIKRIS